MVSEWHDDNQRYRTKKETNRFGKEPGEKRKNTKESIKKGQYKVKIEEEPKIYMRILNSPHQKDL